MTGPGWTVQDDEGSTDTSFLLTESKPRSEVTTSFEGRKLFLFFSTLESDFVFQKIFSIIERFVVGEITYKFSVDYTKILSENFYIIIKNDTFYILCLITFLLLFFMNVMIK